MNALFTPPTHLKLTKLGTEDNVLIPLSIAVFEKSLQGTFCYAGFNGFFTVSESIEEIELMMSAPKVEL